MCIGGGGSKPVAATPAAPPPAPPPPAPVTAKRLEKKSKRRLTRAGRTRRQGAARGALVIKRAPSGVQYQSSGSGVSV